MRRLITRLRALPFPERTVLLSILAVVACVWGFAKLADEIGEPEKPRFDEMVLKVFRHADDPTKPVGPHWLLETGRDITSLGGGTLITLTTLLVMVYLWMRKKYALVALVFASVVGGALLSTLLKQFFDRERPSVVPHLMQVTSPSFPSGHSMLSAITYLTLGALLARTVTDRVLKIYFIGVAMLLTGMIGITRLYLGVHYPTDVLAGWCAGVAWATICVMTARWLQNRGAVEQADPPAPGSSS